MPSVKWPRTETHTQYQKTKLKDFHFVAANSDAHMNGVCVSWYIHPWTTNSWSEGSSALIRVFWPPGLHVRTQCLFPLNCTLWSYQLTLLFVNPVHFRDKWQKYTKEKHLIDFAIFPGKAAKLKIVGSCKFWTRPRAAGLKDHAISREVQRTSLLYKY